MNNKNDSKEDSYRKMVRDDEKKHMNEKRGEKYVYDVFNKKFTVKQRPKKK